MTLSLVVKIIWNTLEILIFIYTFRIGKFASIQTFYFTFQLYLKSSQILDEIKTIIFDIRLT